MVCVYRFVWVEDDVSGLQAAVSCVMNVCSHVIDRELIFQRHNMPLSSGSKYVMKGRSQVMCWQEAWEDGHTDLCDIQWTMC